jgi:hypothetical protein
MGTANQPQSPETGDEVSAGDEANYILGHSEAEIRRLQMQATILRPITERLLQSAGIRPGMRVLDLGSGAGDGVSVVGVSNNIWNTPA